MKGKRQRATVRRPSKRVRMARLFVKALLADDSFLSRYEIAPQELIDKFIGSDTGAPLKEALFTLETDDGYAVSLRVAVPGPWPSGPAKELKATVKPPT